MSSLLSSSFISALACRKCGTIGLPVLTPGTGPHAHKGWCGSCGKFIQFVSRYSPEEQALRRSAARTAAMSSKPPTKPQLAYLSTLGDVQPAPTTMQEASVRIEALLVGKGGRV